MNRVAVMTVAGAGLVTLCLTTASLLRAQSPQLAAQLAQVWKTTTQAANGVWDDPVYADFFAAVRDVNARLPAEGRIRVFGGDPVPGDTMPDIPVERSR